MNLTPLWNVYQAPEAVPVEHLLSGNSFQEKIFLLDSSNHKEDYLELTENAFLKTKSLRSYFGVEPCAEFIWHKGTLTVHSEQFAERFIRENISPLEALQQLDRFVNQDYEPTHNIHDYLKPQYFICLTYDFGEELQNISNPKQYMTDIPGIYCCLCKEQVIIDHCGGFTLYYRLDHQRHSLTEMRWRFEKLTEFGRKEPAPLFKKPRLSSNFVKEDYMEAIRWVKHYIREGHVYQINLSQIFTFPWHYSPESLYKKIRLTNPAPFGAFFKYADWAILSTSPERFLYRVNNVISTEPIKGTMPRGRTPEEDEANVRDLLSSIKERAEHIMIVDLLRNDLGRICEYGTVHVEDRFYVEKYRSVHQLISRVVGRLRSDASLGFVLAETFPGGSITGAPKIRAMEIIAESEPHKRSAYTGTIGRVSINRNNFDLSILIRTIIMQKGFAALSLGGGIVFDSEELAEYQETIDKGAAIVHALHF